MFDKLPPGQQPHRRTAIAATSPREKASAKRKATKGMITNWQTKASRTPTGLRMCSPSWLTSTVQPSPSMVKQRTSPTNTLIPWLSGESQKAGIRWDGSVGAATKNSAQTGIPSLLPLAASRPATMASVSGRDTTFCRIAGKFKPGWVELSMAQPEDGGWFPVLRA